MSDRQNLLAMLKRSETDFKEHQVDYWDVITISPGCNAEFSFYFDGSTGSLERTGVEYEDPYPNW
jgi:hypothetical protein